MISKHRADAVRALHSLIQIRGGKARELLSKVLQNELGLDLSPSDERAVARLYRQLADQTSVLEIHPSTDNDYWVHSYRGYRDLLIARALAAYGNRSAAMHVVKKVRTIAVKYHLTDVLCECLLRLRSFESFGGSAAKVRDYTRLLQKATAIREAEEEVLSYIDSSNVRLSGVQNISRAEQRTMWTWAMRARRYADEYDTWTLQLSAWRLTTRVLQLRRDWQATLDRCDALLDWISRFPQFDGITRVGEVIVKQFICYLALRDYDRAHRRVLEVRPGLSTTSVVRLNINEYVYDLAIITCRFAEAADACADVRQQHGVLNTPFRKEMWRFHELLLSVIADAVPSIADEIRGRIGNVGFYAANIEKTLATIIRDKKGMNVTITTLRFLDRLTKKRYSDAVAMREQLQTYSKRYLRDMDTMRSAVFMRMLVKMIKYDFDPVLLQEECRDDYEILEVEYKHLDDTGEYVPYERLWDIMIDVLFRNKESPRRRR